MAIGSPPITWDLKHTGELWVYIGTPLPNPSGNTGVMLCMYLTLFTVTAILVLSGFGRMLCATPVPQAKVVVGTPCGFSL